MSAALALADDGLTIEFEGADECPDLTAEEAEVVTGRIRRWVNDFPVSDVVLAFRGRVWIALAYDSWAEWCECELGGLKLPAPKRREVVKELTTAGMSNRAIADTIGVAEGTVRNDRKATAQDYAVDPERKTLGQDGRERSQPQPKPAASEPEPVIDAEIICRDCDGHGCETCFPADDSATDEQMCGQQEAPVQKPRRRPLEEGFFDATMRLTKAVTSLENLGNDDRLPRNKNQVARYRNDLIRAIDALQRVANQLA